jgi:hypothetical protein
MATNPVKTLKTGLDKSPEMIAAINKLLGSLKPVSIPLSLRP